MTFEFKRDFLAKGYSVVKSLHSGTEVQSWKLRLQDLLAQNPDPSGVKVWMVEELPDFLKPAMTHPGTASALRELVGPAIEFLSVKAVFKNPQVDFPSPWHHDWFYWGGAPKISIWIALDDATPDNGCLKVIPGSQLKEFPLTEVKSDKGFGNRIEDSALAGLPVRSLPARAGDAIFFSDRLVHSSHPNSAKRDRWSLISTYRRSDIPDSSSIWKSSWQL